MYTSITCINNAQNILFTNFIKLSDISLVKIFWVFFLFFIFHHEKKLFYIDMLCPNITMLKIQCLEIWNVLIFTLRPHESSDFLI